MLGMFLRHSVVNSIQLLRKTSFVHSCFSLAQITK